MIRDASPHQGLANLVPVDRIVDGLADLEFGHRVVTGLARRTHQQEADAHGLALRNLKALASVQTFCQIGRHPPNPFCATGQQFSHLRAAFLDPPEHQLADGRRLRPTLHVFIVFLEDEPLAVCDYRHLVRTGADRLRRHALRSGLPVIFVGVYHDHGREILHRRRERIFELGPHLVLADLLAARDELGPAQRLHLILFVREIVEREDHVVGVEFFAVVENHVLAQVEFDRRGVDPFISRRLGWAGTCRFWDRFPSARPKHGGQ